MATTSRDDGGKERDVRELLRDIKEGRVPTPAGPMNLKGAYLAGEDLSGMDLSGADLTQADLTGANLSKARLFQATLEGAVLINANLSRAELTAANLAGANMENANAVKIGLGMACLEKARLFNANMAGATLTKACLRGADLRCTCLQSARIREADMSDADLTEADLVAADLALCNVTGAKLRNANLCAANLRAIRGFEKADWIGADIRDMNLAGALRLRRFVVDQNYIKEFRESSRLASIAYYFWWITSDCGRSLARWCFWITLQMLVFAQLYAWIGLDYGKHPTPLSPLYFSVATLTTLGYGDVVPMSVTGQAIAMLEVITGYVMLGGLLSILSVKMARRAN